MKKRGKLKRKNSRRPKKRRNPSSLILYHGTEEARIKQIKEEGLRPSYFTDSLKAAKYFGNLAASETWGGDGRKPSIYVLKVKIPDTTKLKADLYYFKMPVLFSPKKWPKNSRDWKTSLKEVHAVFYSGRIPPENILSIKRYKFEDPIDEPTALINEALLGVMPRVVRDAPPRAYGKSPKRKFKKSRRHKFRKRRLTF